MLNMFKSETQKNWNKTYKNKKEIDIKPILIPIATIIICIFSYVLWKIYIA